MIICKLDNSEFSSLDELHSYLKRKRIKREKYYHDYFPRYDKLTNELIPFKSYDQYFGQDFKNKENMRLWFLRSGDDGKEYSLKILEDRIDKKKLKLVPTEVELRSTMMPSVHYYMKTFGSFNKVCAYFELKPRFSNEIGPLPDSVLSSSAEIIIDTREQHPLKFASRKTISAKIKCGDYGLSGDLNENIYVERKSLNDFANTLSGGFERFEREIIRAKSLGHYIVTLVENDINKALAFNFLPHMQFGRATPQHVFHNLRELLEKYENFQIAFCRNRAHVSEVTEKIFAMGDEAKNIDIQFRIERKEL